MARRAHQVPSAPVPGPRFPRQVVVRITDELYAEIERDAEANGRTPGQTIRFRLEQTYGLRDGD